MGENAKQVNSRPRFATVHRSRAVEKDVVLERGAAAGGVPAWPCIRHHTCILRPVRMYSRFAFAYVRFSVRICSGNVSGFSCIPMEVLWWIRHDANHAHGDCAIVHNRREVMSRTDGVIVHLLFSF